MTLGIATDTLRNLKIKIKLAKDAYIYSDQGGHYTSVVYQKLVKKSKLRQSMSRRGNCWDNSPKNPTLVGPVPMGPAISVLKRQDLAVK
ncbi:hypothetical protein SAMN05428981_107101 [Bacillus sp. OV194]|nr:hypothetical protein SAMN05428981_107101 [Bacillus sp. OV194]